MEDSLSTMDEDGDVGGIVGTIQDGNVGTMDGDVVGNVGSNVGTIDDGNVDMEYEEEDEEFFNLVGSFSASISLLGSLAALEFGGTFQPGWKLGCPVTKRERVPVADIFSRLDDR